MKPTSDKFDPRPDGWFQHEARWGEVVVGTVLATDLNPKQRWEVIDVAQVGPTEFGHTLWMRIREQTTGEEHTLPPRFKKDKAVILTQSPHDTEAGPPTPPSNAEAIQLLIDELGATVLASRDETTGEIVCPDYINTAHEEFSPGHKLRGLIEHLRFAHALSVNDDLELAPAYTLHGQAHNPKWPNIGKGGFPHRHVPEDLRMF